MNKAKRITVSGKIDLRSLATVINWLASNGIRPQSKSDALHMIVEAMTEQVLKNGQGRLYPTVEEAIGALEVYGLNFTPNKNTKQGRELYRALTLPEFGTPKDLARRASLESEFEEALSQFQTLKEGGRDEIQD